MLKGKTALVTGSTSGIGLGIAISLARQGANILLNGFGDHGPAQAQIEALGAKVGYHGADMSKPAEIAEMMAAAQSQFGGVDVLVNNAGIQHVANVEDFPPEKWDAILAINLSSAFHTTRLALPAMKVASAQKSAYVAAKHGLVGFTKTVALETARSGVTVNAICPGWVLTPLVQKQIDDRAAKEGIPVTQATTEMLQEKEPSLRFTTPEQLGDLAVFFCSGAGDNITGVAWNMDGGWVAQ
jgi:3-hydroxybutyrate dehydrogenase